MDLGTNSGSEDDNLLNRIISTIKSNDDVTDNESQFEKLKNFKLRLNSDEPFRAEVINAGVLWCATHSFVLEIHEEQEIACHSNSAIQKINSKSSVDVFQHYPFTLTPTTIAITEYLELCETSKIFHKLVDKMSRDYDFLIPQLETLAKADPEIIGKYLSIMKKQQRMNEFNQYVQMGLFRSDFMENMNNKNQLKSKWGQIEINACAVGGFGLAPLIQQLHDYILNRYGDMHLESENKTRNNNKTECNNENDIKAETAEEMNSINTDGNIKYCKNAQNNLLSPVQYSLDCICKTLAAAARVNDASNPLVLMVVSVGYNLIIDQFRIQSHLFEKYGVPLERRTLTQLHTDMILDSETKNLILNTVDGKKVVTCAYIRAGDDVIDFAHEYEWEVFERIQFSNAVQEPIGIRMFEKKFMQAVWTSNIDVLLRYLTMDEAQKLQKHFFALHVLDSNLNANTMSILKDAEENPHKYVLKPQREGGGYNFFDEDISRIIRNARNSGNVEEVMARYILMERIQGQTSDAWFVCQRNATFVESLPEIGFFSCFLSGTKDGEKAMIDEVSGMYSRTKISNSNEGGIYNGMGAMDSVLVVC